ncbi:MAG: hypothetical protein IPP94_17535 [Ignavibacteria bacterium]|nr:hypothetical protein [Ignavibacteria bacterium]
MEKNFVHSFRYVSTVASSNMIGMYIAGGTATYKNNMIRLGIDETGADVSTGFNITGMLKGTATNNNVYHNTVYIGGAGVTTGTNATYAYRRSAIAIDDVRDNLFANARSNGAGTGKHYAYWLNSVTAQTSDYNMVRASGTGGVLASVDGGATDRNTLQALRAAFATMELHSVAADPSFVAPGGTSVTVDLHLNSTTPAEAAGIAIGGVTDDFDGQTRSSLSPTDMGADAGSFTAVDLSTPAITFTPLANTTSTSNRVLGSVVITDIGTGVPLAGNVPTIWYKKNFTGGWVMNAGVNMSGNGNSGTWDFTIDYSLLTPAPVSGDSIYYYIVAQDQATPPNLWYNAFTATQPVHSSVTTQTTPIDLPNAYVIGTTLSGTVNVGVGQTYTSLTNAGGLFQAINSGTVSGNIIASITSDLGEDGTFALNQWTESGVGNWTLTILPDANTMRTISGIGAANTALIRFNGADRVTIDGQYGGSGAYLLFREKGATQPLFAYLNDATNNAIRNCTVEGSNASSSASNAGLVYFGTGTSSGNSNNSITRCTLRDRSDTTTVNYPAFGVYAYSTAAAAAFNKNVSVSENEIFNIYNQNGTSGYLYISTGNTDWTLSGNRIYHNIASPPAFASGFLINGIYVSNTGNNFVLSGNIIGYNDSTSSGVYTISTAQTVTFSGMYLSVGTAVASSVQGNAIKAINFTTAGTGSFFTGYNFAGGNINVGTSAGNSFGDTTSTGSITTTCGSTGTLYAMYCLSSGALNVFNNVIGSVLVNATSTSATANMSGFYISNGAHVISNNRIGSFGTTSSINLATASTSATAQSIHGMQILGGTTTVNGNVFSNLNNNYAGTGAGFIRAISITGGVITTTNNVIRNFTTTSGNPSTVTSGSSAVMGISNTSSSAGQVITGNQIFNLSASHATATTSAAGIYYGMTSTGNMVAKNFIHSLSVATTSTSAGIGGIVSAPTAGAGTIQNNMIRLGLDSAGNSLATPKLIYGIHKGTTSGFLVYFNSVYIGGTGVGTTAVNTHAMYRSTGVATDDLRNNVFVNNRSNSSTGGKHYADYNASTTVAFSDYNLYQAGGTGGILAYAGADRTTLQALRENFANQELHSGVGDPAFADATGPFNTVNLHVSATTPVEGAGIAIGTVVDDWDGQSRSGLTPPDIGADAGNFTNSDVYTPFISFTAVGNTSSTGSRTISAVVITDQGTGVPTSGANVPRIWYKKNFTGGWVSNAGSFISGSGTNGTWDFTLDYSLLSGAPVTGDSIYYYVAAQDAAGTPNIWYRPFAGALHADVNTQTAPPSTPFSYKIAPAIITVGSGGTYATLTGAAGFFQTINTSTVSENLTVQIISDITEPGTYALNQWVESGAGGYTITIQPDGTTMRTLSNTITNGLIRLDGADRVTIDGSSGGSGRYLTIRQTNVSYPTVTLINDARKNTVRNCVLEGQLTSTSTGIVLFSTTTGTLGNDSNTVTQCLIRNVSAQNNSIGIYASGTTTTTNHFNSNNAITDNLIANPFLATGTCAGIYVTTGNTDWTITGNRIYQEATRVFTSGITHYGIYVSNASGNNFVVNNNLIGFADSTGAGFTTQTISTTALARSYYGVYLSVGTTTASSVQGNVIGGIVDTSAVTTIYGWAGIYLVGGAINVGNVTGNTIGDAGTGSISCFRYSSSGGATGIYSTSSGIVNISNNAIGSIRTYGTTGATNGSASIYGIYATTGTLTVSGNTIGHPSTVNSLNASSQANTTSSQRVWGIFSSSSPGTTTISNNLVANVNNSSIATGTSSTSEFIGINVTAGVNLISGNTIRNATTSTMNTNLGSTAAMNGISHSSATAGQFISQNTIHSLSNSAAASQANIIGISYNSASTGTNLVERNFIHSLTSPSTGGAGLVGIYAASGAVTYQNNMVRLGIDTAGASITAPCYIYGFLKAITTAMNFYHNSVYIGGAGVTASAVGASAAFRRAFAGTDDIRNNIFVNDRSNASTGGKHYAYVLESSVIAFSDYNIYKAGGTGGVLASITGMANDLATLQALREAFAGQDLHSGAGDPNYVNATGSASVADLHVQSSTAAEGAGTVISGVSNDFDGASRASNTPTDIGADAGTFTTSAGSDIFPPVITVTLLSNTSSTSNRTLTGVAVTDVSTGVPTSGGNVPRIWYKKNFAGSWVSNGGTLAAGSGTSGTWSFLIDYSLLSGAPVSGDSIYYYVAAQDQATVPNLWYAPFAGASHSSVNTQITAPTMPSVYAITGTLAGAINVGTGQTYTSLTNDGGLFQAINGTTVSGNLTVSITSDLTESGKHPLNQWLESGAGNYTLAIGPSSATERLIAGASDTANGLIRFTGADRVTIDGRYSGSGKYLRFRNQSLLVGTIGFYNDATNNVMRNCTVEGSTISLINGTITFGMGITTGNDNNTITECDIRDLSNVVATPRTPVHSRGNNATYAQYNSGITISNCNIYDYWLDGGQGFAVRADTGSTEWTVSGNSVYQTVVRNATLGNSGWRGLYFSDPLAGGHLVSGNIIGGSAPNAGGAPWTSTTSNGQFTSFYPMFFNLHSPANASSVQGNVVKNLDMTITSQAFVVVAGVLVNSGYVNIGNVTGNVIGDTASTGSIVYTINGLTGCTYTGIDHRGVAGTIQNNRVGSITFQGSNTGIVSFYGVFCTAAAGAFTINNNIVGSVTTANSIQTPTSASSLWIQMTGIYSQLPASGLSQLTNNTVANLTNNSENLNSYVRGMYHVTSAATIQSNQIYNLTCASAMVGGGAQSAVTGMSISNSYGPTLVSQNVIHSLSSTVTTGAPAAYVQGMYYFGPLGAGNLIERNFIHSLSSVTPNASSFQIVIYAAGGTATFQNNIVQLGIDAAGNSVTTEQIMAGIYKNSSSNNTFFHNSVYVGGTGVGSATNAPSYAFRRATSAVLDDIRDNLFVNERSNATTGSKHYAYFLNANTNINSDYNIYRASGTGGVLATVDGGTTDRLTLQALRENMAGFDMNSGVGNPNFVNAAGNASAVDLHLSSPTPAEGAGTSITGITDDFDGQTRAGLTPVDIGADAGSFTTNAGTDIFPPTIAYAPLGNTSSTSNPTLSNVVISDVGTGVPTSGSLQPRIWFKNFTKGGAWASTAGTLGAGSGNSGSWSFTIDYSLVGGTPSNGDVIKYYIVAQDQATAANLWYNPFAGASHSDVNTQGSAPTTPNSYTISGASLAGSYIIGPGQTYTSLTNAGGLFEAINNGALSGDLVASIANDINEVRPERPQPVE